VGAVKPTSDPRNAFAELLPSADDNSPVTDAVFDDHRSFAVAEVECWTLCALLQLKQASLQARVYRVSQVKIHQHENHDICVVWEYFCTDFSSFI